MQSKNSSIVHVIDPPIETGSRTKRCIEQQQLHHRQFSITKNICNQYVGRINTLSRSHDIERSTSPQNDTRHICIVSDLLSADNNDQNCSFHSWNSNIQYYGLFANLSDNMHKSHHLRCHVVGVSTSLLEFADVSHIGPLKTLPASSPPWQNMTQSRRQPHIPYHYCTLSVTGLSAWLRV